MFKKIKEKIQQGKAKKEEMLKLEKMKKYYEILRCGASFIKFIQDDLNKVQNDTMNRHQRRRLQKTLQKGEITADIVNHYSSEVDRILALVNGRLNPTKPVDGAKLYADAKKKEKK
jgi:hypothetical protein